MKSWNRLSPDNDTPPWLPSAFNVTASGAMATETVTVDVANMMDAYKTAARLVETYDTAVVRNAAGAPIALIMNQDYALKRFAASRETEEKGE